MQPVRFGPEMNGNWNIYGLQPLMYVQVWKTMYAAIKAIVPGVAIVWAPNTGQGCVQLGLLRQSKSHARRFFYSHFIDCRQIPVLYGCT